MTELGGELWQCGSGACAGLGAVTGSFSEHADSSTSPQDFLFYFLHGDLRADARSDVSTFSVSFSSSVCMLSRA